MGQDGAQERAQQRANKRLQTQTPEQRKRNLKFAKEQTAKRGKSASEIKKREQQKSPISPLWLGMCPLSRTVILHSFLYILSRSAIYALKECACAV